MKSLTRVLLALTFTVGFSSASQAVVSLDFETNPTGADIVNNPLLTGDGIITSSSTGGNLYIANAGGSGLTGNVLRFDESVDGQYAQLAFDYDVSSVSFLFAGFLSGFFTGQVLDASFNVVDSFFDGNTDNDLPGGPVVLSGANIRYFRFFDGPGGASFAGVDNVLISPSAAVPEPVTLTLTLLGLLGAGFVRKQKT